MRFGDCAVFVVRILSYLEGFNKPLLGNGKRDETHTGKILKDLRTENIF